VPAPASAARTIDQLRGNLERVARMPSHTLLIRHVHREPDVVDAVSRDNVCSVNSGVRVFPSFEAADDADDQFYAQLTPEERLDVLLELTERERSTLGEAASRFERVHRIVELSQR
jgi:hypothetical protein